MALIIEEARRLAVQTTGLPGIFLLIGFWYGKNDPGNKTKFEQKS